MTTLKVKTQRVGYHKWPLALPHRAYLKEVHRHLFTLLVEVKVRGDDRELEFHDLLDLVEQIPFCATSSSCSPDALLTRSCEQMAKAVVLALINHLPNPNFIAVEVWEDESCGARVTWRVGQSVAQL